MDSDQLLNSSEADLLDYVEQQYWIEPIRLSEGQISVDQSEIDMRGASNTFFVPFTGDTHLFGCTPSTYTTSRPTGGVSAGELALTYNTTHSDAKRIRSQFDRDLGEVKRYLAWIESEVSAYNRSIRQHAETTIRQRKQKIRENRGLVASLGFPMRKRQDAPRTYAVPEVRRKPQIRRPAATTEPYTPDPSLDESEYKNILSVIDNMVWVMERSPRAFSTMNEEDFRQHFLVQLNGQYEGQATGETFNYEGKTDILVRAEERNIFIAECKFWRGEKSFAEAINQILGYISWRDTKTAILVFNRNKNFTTVLEKIANATESHPNFKRFIDYEREAGWRAVFHHKDDPNRELHLSVHAYDVPSDNET